ncbi:hypothetical protein E2562_000145 [Oryza meyeriana var. granulata]|uniref:Uncharacterized protein n=1 Tax=Oryza meyeriana var. granulata TaxID=110450 RepID=A0A6G1DBN5_9ORYZ|nr:hypothetical protein E2562_000145 [Oryza meyeriana var. granulata]
MALRGINLRKKPLLLTRPFSSSSLPNPPFSLPRHLPTTTVTTPPVPPPLPRPPNPAATLFQDIRERLRSTPSPPSSRWIQTAPPLRARHTDDLHRRYLSPTRVLPRIPHYGECRSADSIASSSS